MCITSIPWIKSRDTLQRILIASALDPFIAFCLSSDCFFVFFAFLVCDICPPLPLLDSLRQVMVVQNAR